MILLKTAGALTLLLCSLEIAKRLNRAAREDIRIIEAYTELIRYVRTQIDCFAMPIGEILKKCDGGLLVGCGWQSDSIPESLYEIYTSCPVKDGEASKLISSFCADFGNSYLDSQIKLCDTCIEELEKRRTELFTALGARVKLNLTLCISSSLALIILFV